MKRRSTCTAIICSLVLLSLLQAYSQDNSNWAQQANTDGIVLQQLMQMQCDDDFPAYVKSRSEIANRDPKYLSEFPNVRLMMLYADGVLLACAEKHFLDLKDLKKNEQTCQQKLNEAKQSVENCKDEMNNRKGDQGQAVIDRDNAIIEKDNAVIEKIKVIQIFKVTAGVGGISIIVLIIMIIKIKSAKELLIEEGKKLFDETIDAIREKLLDLLLAGDEDDDEWKERYKKVQQLFDKYQRKELPASEFKKQLSLLLVAK